MATSKAEFRDALVAGADLSGHLFKLVKIVPDAAGNANTSRGVLVATGAGEAPYGVIEETATQGRPATVACSGLVKVMAGAAIPTGSPVMSDAQGRAVPATGTNKVFGIARLGASAAGVIAEVYVDKKSTAA